MSPEDTPNVVPTPEEPKAAAPVEPPTPPEPVAPAAPPADPVKQMGEAAHQASESIDKAMAGVGDQNRVLIVAIASILVGGWLGAMLNGQVMKGVGILVAAFVCGFMGFILAPFTFFLSLLLPLALHVVAVLDAILIANRKSKGETFAEWDFFTKPTP